MNELFDGINLTCQQTLGGHQFDSNRISNRKHCLHIEGDCSIGMWMRSHGELCVSLCVCAYVSRDGFR